MRCYDPAGRIVYVHLTGRARPRGTSHGTSHGTTSPMDARTPDRLPAGYANHSPRTRLRRDAGDPRPAGAPEFLAGARSGDRCPDPRRRARERSEVRLVTAEGLPEGVAGSVAESVARGVASERTIGVLP